MTNPFDIDPISLGHELAYTASVVATPALLDNFPLVDGDLHHPGARAIVEAVKAVRRTRRNVSIAALRRQLQEDPGGKLAEDAVAMLESGMHVEADLDPVVASLRERGACRRAVRAALDLAKVAKSGNWRETQAAIAATAKIQSDGGSVDEIYSAAEAMRLAVTPRRAEDRRRISFEPSLDGVIALTPGKLLTIGLPTNVGKGHRRSDVVLTPQGWREVGRLAEGDFVIGQDGTPTRVRGVYARGVLPVMRVTFDDGAYVDCDPDHLWSVASDEQLCDGKAWRAVSTAEIAASGMHPRKWRVPVVAPVQHPDRALPVAPYLLGVLLGDGSLSGSAIRWDKDDEQIGDRVRDALPAGHALVKSTSPTRCTSWSIKGVAGKNTIRDGLNALGLIGSRSWEKWIPAEYLVAAIPQRLELLRGLMDTDGTVGEDGTGVQFSTSATGLRDGVIALVRSLGGIARVTSKIPTYEYLGERREGRRHYTLTLALPNEIVPFALDRKVERYRRRTRTRLPSRRIVSIEDTGAVDEIVCIAVDHPTQTYVARDYVVTHNTSLLRRWLRQAARTGTASSLITVEDTAEMIGGGWVSEEGQVPGESVRDLCMNAEETTRAAEAIERAAAYRLWVTHVKDRSLERVLANIRASAALGAKLIAIDYLQAIRGDNALRTRKERIDHNLNELIACTATLDVAVILASQLVRPPDRGSKWEPTLFDLKESGDIENCSTYVVIGWRDGEDDTAPIVAKVAKSKDGKGIGRRVAWIRDEYAGVLGPTSPPSRAKRKPGSTDGW